MYVYVKYLILLTGFIAAFTGIYEREMAPALVSAGAFLSYALIEIRDLKTINDEKE